MSEQSSASPAPKSERAGTPIHTTLDDRRRIRFIASISRRAVAGSPLRSARNHDATPPIEVMLDRGSMRDIASQAVAPALNAGGIAGCGPGTAPRAPPSCRCRPTRGPAMVEGARRRTRRARRFTPGVLFQSPADLARLVEDFLM
jgi:hypothetical protein